MSTLSRDDVARIADLACIKLSPEEVRQFATELDVIVDAVARVSQVATAEVPATTHPLPLINVWREDEPVPPLTIAEVLAGAPAVEDNMFAVPQILGEE